MAANVKLPTNVPLFIQLRPKDLQSCTAMIREFGQALFVQDKIGSRETVRRIEETLYHLRYIYFSYLQPCPPEGEDYRMIYELQFPELTIERPVQKPDSAIRVEQALEPQILIEEFEMCEAFDIEEFGAPVVATTSQCCDGAECTLGDVDLFEVDPCDPSDCITVRRDGHSPVMYSLPDDDRTYASFHKTRLAHIEWHDDHCKQTGLAARAELSAMHSLTVKKLTRRQKRNAKRKNLLLDNGVLANYRPSKARDKPPITSRYCVESDGDFTILQAIYDDVNAGCGFIVVHTRKKQELSLCDATVKGLARNLIDMVQ